MRLRNAVSRRLGGNICGYLSKYERIGLYDSRNSDLSASYQVENSEGLRWSNSLKMAKSISLASVCAFTSSNIPGVIIANSVLQKAFWVDGGLQNLKARKFQSLEVKAGENNRTTKPRSIVCSDCEGNGAILCSQCKGGGVNTEDLFNGKVKAGQLCWLCRGKREILCGNCNGAGFVGGFMSTSDE